MKKILLTIAIFAVLPAFLSAQGTFNYAAQKSLIPKDLGKIYLGMTFKELADEIALGKAVVVNHRFEWLELLVPVKGKDVESVRIRIHGLSQEEKAVMLVSETASDGDEDEDIERIVVSRIPKSGFVYAMYVEFRPDFNLKSWALRTYGT
ncbi:MAG: hypothetical protein OEM82_15570, partial [Acidobacteriota bacterium]|nr:hypothetical protein [Acidobacteriota bacterium]